MCTFVIQRRQVRWHAEIPYGYLHLLSARGKRARWHVETNVVICTFPGDVNVFRSRLWKSLVCYPLDSRVQSMQWLTSSSAPLSSRDGKFDDMRRHLMVIRPLCKLEASKPVGTQRLTSSFAPFLEMSVSFGRDFEKVSFAICQTQGSDSWQWLTLSSAPLPSRDGKSDDMRRYLMVIRTFFQLEASEPVDT